MLPPTFSYADAQRTGFSDRDLQKMLRSGEIFRLSRGIYRQSNATPIDEDLLEIAARAPEATLCLLTALSRHALTDQIPSRIDVALRRQQRPPKINAPVAWHRFDTNTYEIGREVIEIGDGFRINLYNPERCIVDAFRLRHLEGDDIAAEALRRWLRRPGASPATLLNLSAYFPKADPALRTALRILL